MVDGVIGEHTELVAKAAEQEAKRKQEHALILSEVMVKLLAAGPPLMHLILEVATLRDVQVFRLLLRF